MDDDEMKWNEKKINEMKWHERECKKCNDMTSNEMT
jgi:hypothetical protein